MTEIMFEIDKFYQFNKTNTLDTIHIKNVSKFEEITIYDLKTFYYLIHR